jgi:putative SOS response-associated peptidase YedK
MCGRFALSIKTKDVEKLLPGLKSKEEIKPKYNISPSQNIAAVLNDDSSSIKWLKWGLIPFWTKDESIGTRLINARSETLTEKASFKYAFKQRRCLILTTGYYEWKFVEGSKIKIPYFISLQNGDPFTFAGLWEKWIAPDKTELLSTTIITTSPNPLMSNIYNRMPCIILPEDREQWLNPKNDTLSLQKCLIPYPKDDLAAWQVSLKVNNPAYDSPDCIEKIVN